VDSSVVVEYLTEGSRLSEARAAIGRAPVAPHLIDAEVGSALRRLESLKVISEEYAERSLVDLDDLPLTRSPHRFLMETAWPMRARLSFHDALYAALAAELDVELITADRRLARAARSFGIRARALGE
jgi:predicted nucleic acid-binding protein